MKMVMHMRQGYTQLWLIFAPLNLHIKMHPFHYRIRGAFTPECTDEGLFTRKQCHGSTGHCWCVEQATGGEIAGTRKPSWQGDPECHLTACQRQAKTISNQLGQCLFLRKNNVNRNEQIRFVLQHLVFFPQEKHEIARITQSDNQLPN